MFQHTAARRRLGGSKRKNGWSSWFQHTAARRRLGDLPTAGGKRLLFQHTAARRRLEFQTAFLFGAGMFQHTAARRRLCVVDNMELVMTISVSTHSRPKAAGRGFRQGLLRALFQHTAARRRLEPLSKALLHQVSQP